MNELAIENMDTLADMNAVVGGWDVFRGKRIISGPWRFRGTIWGGFKGLAYDRRYGLLKVKGKTRVFQRTQTMYLYFTHYRR